MEKENNITTILDNATPVLKDAERSALWSAIEQKSVARPVSVISPYRFIFSTSKKMTALVGMLFFVTATGGVAFASNAARPGDSLFPIDRALEDVQLRLIRNEESKTTFKNKLSHERVVELQTIVDEQSKTGSLKSDLLSEQRVGDAVNEIVRFIDDSNLNETSKNALVLGVAEALQISGELERHDNTLRIRSDKNDQKTEIRIDDDGESRIEFYNNDERIRILNKNGETRIKTKNDDDGESGEIRIESKTDSDSFEDVEEDRDDSDSRADDERSSRSREDEGESGKDRDNDDDESDGSDRDDNEDEDNRGRGNGEDED